MRGGEASACPPFFLFDELTSTDAPYLQMMRVRLSICQNQKQKKVLRNIEIARG